MLAAWSARQRQKAERKFGPKTVFLRERINDHTLTLDAQERMQEDVLTYTNAAGDRRVVLLDHSRCSDQRK